MPQHTPSRNGRQRGRLETYADLVDACPGKVTHVMRDASLNYSMLLEAQAVGLIKLPQEGKSEKGQIVERTTKGENVKDTVYGLLEMLKKL